MEARGVADGERKTITALFADIKGPTALIEDLDPEDARRIIDLALKVMMDAIHRYEGCVISVRRGDQASDQSHQEVDDTAVARVCDLRDVLEWIVDRFNQGPVAQ